MGLTRAPGRGAGLFGRFLYATPPEKLPFGAPFTVSQGKITLAYCRELPMSDAESVKTIHDEKSVLQRRNKCSINLRGARRRSRSH